MGLGKLTDEQLDILGEVANISMGTSATALGMMINQKVNITTPRIEVINRSESLDDYSNICIFVQIHYIKGLEGNNILILKDHDVKCMTDLMMGGDGSNVEGEITDIQLSAASEAMNQMMGSSATSLSSMLGIPVDISTPEVKWIDVESVKIFEKMFETNVEKFVKVTFRMEIGNLVDSTMVQLYPENFACDMCEKFKESKLQAKDTE